ncbi:hypothetical protein FOZ60_008012 [Perkinsus olseni]|uniref:Uncharacterized protein n=1 Tax=Perkinsus olseni TaxID=32597 RepID=A0A7J6PEL9_PEROL|nr:hypothetical protein FOZ60_008012 [Perkinsus olseni]
MAELTLFDLPHKAHLTFWGSKVTGARPRPHAVFVFSLEINPSLYQVVLSNISLPFGDSVEIKTTPDIKKRPEMIKSFNKKFGDFFKALESDFKRVFFTPSRKGKDNDYIDLPIGDQPIRLFYDC